MYLLDATTEVQLAITGMRERQTRTAQENAEWQRLAAAATRATYLIGTLLVALGQALQATGPAQPASAAA
jgi:hypothetical protein